MIDFVGGSTEQVARAEAVEAEMVTESEFVMGSVSETLPARPKSETKTKAEEAPQSQTAGFTGGSGKKDQAELIVDLARARASFFHTPGRDSYAVVEMGKHKEVWDINSQDFNYWLQKLFYDATSRAPGKQALQDAVRLLSSIALFDSPQDIIGYRFAEHNGCIYLDLGNETWEQVRICPDGWRIIPFTESPVKFRRSKGMLSIPRPQRGGDFDWVKPLFNIETNEEWALIISWLIGAMRPKGPFPILVLQGEQGSAKSTTARMLRSLIDPASPAIRTLPTTERNLVISAEGSWVLNFDNLSSIRPIMSDALCRMSTGGGFGTRTLYSDKSEELFESVRPMIINGIPDLTGRNDLADRSIIVHLPPITDKNRMSERDFWAQWEGSLPHTVGALCSAVSVALRDFDKVQMERLPRMADFAKWVTAAEPALPWKTGEFGKAYKLNRDRMIDIAIENDHVAMAIVKFTSGDKFGDYWSGTPTDLLGILNTITNPRITRLKGWPQAANHFSNRLRRAQTFLRTKGIDIERSKSGNRRITIYKTDDTARTVLDDGDLGPDPYRSDDEYDGEEEMY